LDPVCPCRLLHPDKLPQKCLPALNHPPHTSQKVSLSSQLAIHITMLTVRRTSSPTSRDRLYPQISARPLRRA
jgi:hypothetical protein